jgi:hypothetical protein
MSGDLARQLRQVAPFSEDGGLMVRAADALEVGSGTPAFISLVGIPDGVVEVTGAARAVLVADGWLAPDTAERVQDVVWDAGFAAGRADRDAA